MEKLGGISEQVLKGIVQSIDAAVVLHDRQLNVIFINDSFRTIYEIDDQDVLGRSPMEFLPDSEKDQKKAVISRLKQTLKTGKRSNYQEFTYLSPSGKYLNLVGISFPIFDEKKQITNVMSVIHNMTERKRLEQEVVKAAKLAYVAEMAYTIAHEINNPLTGMKLGLSTLRDRLNGEENIRIVDGVVKDLNRIQDAVRSFLRSSKKPARPKEENISSLSEIFKRILFHLSGQLAYKDIKVTNEICHDNGWILLDRDRIHQVFLNILLNAIDAIQEKGEIKIEAAIVNNGEGGDGKPVVRIAITDTGAGIPTEELSRIFEPFHTSKPGGTGLGLSICKDIVHAHGGGMEIESDPGKGTTVTIILPVLDQGM